MALTEEQLVTLIAQLKDPEIHFPGNFDTVKRANAMLMCLCQEAADALSASAPSEQKPVAYYDRNKFYANEESASMCLADMNALRPVYFAPQPDYKAQLEALVESIRPLIKSRMGAEAIRESLQAAIVSVKGGA